MKKLSSYLLVLTVLLLVAAPPAALAAEKKVKGEVVMKMGDKVHLFHSGKVDVQKDIAVGDVLPVYRHFGGKNTPPKEVGKVKVLSVMPPHYFEAQIVKGEAKVGDIATKNETSLLVQPKR